MSDSLEQNGPVSSLEHPLPLRRGAGAKRRLARRLRLLWIAISAAALLGLVGLATFGDGAHRLSFGLLAAAALLLMLFLIREERHVRFQTAQSRYLWHRLRDLSQVFELALQVRSEEDALQLAGLALQQTRVLLRAEFGALIVHGADGEDHVTVHGFEHLNFDHQTWLLEARGLLKDLSLNTPILVPDMEQDPRFARARLMMEAGFRSFAAIAFGQDDHETGLLLAGSTMPCEFRPSDEKTLPLIARQILALVLHSRRLDVLQDRIDELKQENDELLYSSQLKSEFAAVASHEFKTPLTAVKASVDALLSNVRSGDFQDMEELLLVIREEADRLIEMTGRILEISSLDHKNRKMERRPVHLARVVQSCAKTIEVHLQEKDMELRIEGFSDLPAVFADPGAIRQVLINLVNNSIKFSPSGQSVTLKAKALGPQVQVQVIDHGFGIPEEELPRIFERYFQGSRRGDNHVQSAGLGLAIVKQIIDQHQGSIAVKSRPNLGTVFTFHLPVAMDSFGLEGSLLDLHPQGEIEEFLRLSVDWILHVAKSDEAHLFLAKGDELVQFHFAGACKDEAGAAAIARQAFGKGECVLRSHAGSDGSTSIAVPVKYAQTVVGCYLVSRGASSYQQEDLLLVEGIVGRIGRVLEHGLHQPDPGRVLRRAMRAVRDLLQSASRKMPLRVDPGLLAWELATRAGASEDLARDARLAMDFNDVAMAQFGMEIENQPRVLSPEETERLRNHPRVAAGLLADIQEMEDVSRIVLHHHERFDGSGYPDGLAGEDIPVGARIVAVVDAFCSMTSPRKYKPTRSISEAVEELVGFSGRQFDPRLVSRFVELLREKGWISEDEAGEFIRSHARRTGKPARRSEPPSVPVLSADNHGEDMPG